MWTIYRNTFQLLLERNINVYLWQSISNCHLSHPCTFWIELTLPTFLNRIHHNPHHPTLDFQHWCDIMFLLEELSIIHWIRVKDRSHWRYYLFRTNSGTLSTWFRHAPLHNWCGNHATRRLICSTIMQRKYQVEITPPLVKGMLKNIARFVNVNTLSVCRKDCALKLNITKLYQPRPWANSP